MQRLLLVGSLMALLGCARTSVSSLAAPELQGRTFQTILVIGRFDDINIRREIEDRFASRMGESQQRPTRFVSSYRVFFPGREYTADETKQRLTESHVDASLVILATSAGAVAAYVPPTYTTTCSTWSSEYGCTQTTTTENGGFSVDYPWAKFTAQLYDATTGVLVWTASATTNGSPLATDVTLVHSLVDEVLWRLSDDHITQ